MHMGIMDVLNAQQLSNTLPEINSRENINRLWWRLKSFTICSEFFPVVPNKQC